MTPNITNSPHISLVDAAFYRRRPPLVGGFIMRMPRHVSGEAAAPPNPWWVELMGVCFIAEWWRLILR